MKVFVEMDYDEVRGVRLARPSDQCYEVYEVDGAEGKVLVDREQLNALLTHGGEMRCVWPRCTFDPALYDPQATPRPHSGSCPLAEEGPKPNRVSPAEAFRELRELAGDTWDGVDVEEFVRELRGMAPPLRGEGGMSVWHCVRFEGSESLVRSLEFRAALKKWFWQISIRDTPELAVFEGSRYEAVYYFPPGVADYFAPVLWGFGGLEECEGPPDRKNLAVVLAFTSTNPFDLYFPQAASDA